MAGNQYQADPRQADFLARYLNPDSDTYANALQSGLAAGYTQEYAENIMSLMPDWLSDSIEEANLVAKAVRNFNKLLDSADERVLLDTSKFVAERLHKNKFSNRTELTGDKGKDLTLGLTPEQKEKLDSLL
jgi:hypothetical protein